MSPGSGSARAGLEARIPVTALFLVALPLFFCTALLAAQPSATYTRFCASCGVRDIETFSSQSGQFIVHGSNLRPRQLTPQRPDTNGLTFLEIEPQLVAVTAERTRSAFIRELELAESSRDKVHVMVLNFAPPHQPIGIISQMHTDGFVYRIAMPARVQGIQLSKALVQSLLLELANRDVQRCAELPIWLVEGMNRQLLTRVVPASVFNSAPLTIERTGYDRLGETKTFLNTNTPLTIQELSFPDLSQAASAQRQQFEASSHLLVHQLLQLERGPQLMTHFIQLLPRSLNWQTALLHVYKDHFDSPLSFEKWWLLNCVRFQNREDRQTWSVELAIDRLNLLLLTSMEVRSSTNTLPQQQDTALQNLIRQTDFAVQKRLLGQKAQQLFMLALSVPEDALPLWSAYQQAIDTYLQRRSLLDYQPGLKTNPEQRLQALLKATLKTLDELDYTRAEFKAGRIPALPKDFRRQAAVP